MKKTECQKCFSLIKNCNYKKHIKSCDGTGPYKKSSSCPFCNVLWEELGISGSNIGNHIRWCLSNPKRGAYIETLKHVIAQMSKESREKARAGIVKAHKDGKYKDMKRPGFTKKHTEETKQKIREKQLLAIANGKIIKAGRCKKIKFNSVISGEFSIDGSWELKFCQWCDENNIKLERTGLRFEYIKLDGKKGYYHPDFKVNEYYIEVKGYETELDKCKWSQFPERLIILRKEQIFNLNNYNSIEDLKQFLYISINSLVR